MTKDANAATDERKPDDIEVHHGASDDGGETDRAVRAAPKHEGQDEPAANETILVPIGDGGRADIAKRFKANRGDKEKPVEATGDFSDPAQTYGTVALQEQDDQPERQEQRQEQQPAAKLKLKVRGEEREVERDEAIRLAKVVTGNDDVEGLNDDQITRLAQIGAAGQSYLDDTRQVLETTRQRVQVSRQHQDEPRPAPQATETNDNDDDGDTNADPVKNLVKEIQYGDPDQAAERLRTTMTEFAKDAVKQVSSDTRVQEDVRNDLRAHDEFVKKHADLASDPIAQTVIRDGLMNGYRDDLRKIGVPEDQIPTDPSALANHHRQYKLQGQPVRSVAKLLDDAAERLTTWRGGEVRREPTPQPKTERQVHVNVNRDTRREAIPQQPTRSNVQPLPAANANRGQPDRSAAVAKAKAARGQV